MNEGFLIPLLEFKGTFNQPVINFDVGRIITYSQKIEQ